MVMTTKALKAMLFLSPICYTTGISLEKFDLIFFHLSVFALFIASIFDKKKRDCDLRIFGIILGFAIVQLFWHEFNPIVINATMNLFMAIFALKIIVEYLDDVDSCYSPMLAAGFINIIVLIVQMFGFDPIIMNPDGEPGGIMGNAPRLGNYLAIIIPFALVRSKAIFTLFLLAGICLKELMVVVIAILLLFVNFPVSRKLFILSILGTIGFIFCLKDSIAHSFYIRWIVWEPTIRQIFQSPLQGHGLGMFPYVSDQFVESVKHVETSFSSLLQLIFGMGFISVFWIIYTIKKLKDKIQMNAETMGILSVLILSLFEYPFQISRLWLTIIAIIAFFIIKQANKTEVRWCQRD